MRKVMISAVLAASALTAAAPAAAQYYPAPPPPYGHAYGYNNHGHIRSLQVRVDRLQRQIQRFDRRNIITNREARELRDDARDLERRLYRAARNGLSQREAYNIERRLQRIEWRLDRDARDGRGWDDRRHSDRDRDGRDDRYEDDRGRYPG